MAIASEDHDVIVVGAGQAGLAMGALLQEAGIDALIVGAEARLGDTWRQRYDSLQLFTPRWLNRLPLDDSKPHAEPNGYPDKHEMADYLEAYAERQRLNLRLSTRISQLSYNNGNYCLNHKHGGFKAKVVISATGPFQVPLTPDFAGALDYEVKQIHTARYQNAAQLKPGNVLVVGCGNSGAQIAVDLAGEREVHLAAGHPVSVMPQTLLGKSIFWWFHRLGVYRAHRDTRIGRRLSQRPDPVIGRGLSQCLRRRLITLHGRVTDVHDRQVYFTDGSNQVVDNLIWATGFRNDYSWLKVPGVLDYRGNPLHHRGVTQAEGLFFLGLPWQYTRKSALIGGVGRDAAYLLPAIEAHLKRS